MVETRDLNGFFSLSFLEDIKQESNILRERWHKNFRNETSIDTVKKKRYKRRKREVEYEEEHKDTFLWKYIEK